MNKVDRGVFDEIKVAQLDQQTSVKIAHSFELPLNVVNKVLQTTQYDNFVKLYPSMTNLKRKDESEQETKEIITHSQYRPKTLQDYDDETISNMIETNRDYLRSLLAIVHLKESRKRELDTEISNAEKYLANLMGMSKVLQEKK